MIPQIAAVFGTCGGGMAVSSAMADFIFMEEKKAKLFVNSPNALEGTVLKSVIPPARHSRAEIQDLWILRGTRMPS